MSEKEHISEEIAPFEQDVSHPVDQAIHRPARINRLGMGAYSILQIVLVFGCVIMANYLLSSFHTRVDLTDRNDFTLSEKTTQFIKGNAINSRETPVKITAVLDPKTKHYFRIKGTLEEYRNQSGGKIELDFVNKTIDESKLAELASTYKRKLFEEVILIDARPSEIDPKDKADPLVKYVKEVPVKQLFEEKLDSDNRAYISSWRTENEITNHLLGAVEGKPKIFYLITDKSRVDNTQGEAVVCREFKAIANSQNILLAPLMLSSVDAIPENADGIAIIGAQTDLERDEVKILDNYWEREGASIFITFDPNTKVRNLEHFLRKWGVDRRSNKVISKRHGQVLTSAKATFEKGHPTTIGLGGLSTQIDGLTSSIRTNNDKQSIGITTSNILRVAPGYWGETGDLTNPTLNEGEEGSTPESAQHPPLHVAASVVRGNDANFEQSKYTGRLIAIGNTDFLKPKNRRAELGQFMDSAMNWLVRREDLIHIGPKKMYYQKISIDPDQKSTFTGITVIALPLISLIIGLVFWNTRRS